MTAMYGDFLEDFQKMSDKGRILHIQSMLKDLIIAIETEDELKEEKYVNIVLFFK